MMIMKTLTLKELSMRKSLRMTAWTLCFVLLFTTSLAYGDTMDVKEGIRQVLGCDVAKNQNGMFNLCFFTGDKRLNKEIQLKGLSVNALLKDYPSIKKWKVKKSSFGPTSFVSYEKIFGKGKVGFLFIKNGPKEPFVLDYFYTSNIRALKGQKLSILEDYVPGMKQYTETATEYPTVYMLQKNGMARTEAQFGIIYSKNGDHRLDGSVMIYGSESRYYDDLTSVSP